MNKEVKYITVDSEHAGQRLDNYLLKELKGVPKSHIYRIIRSGEVRINKKRAKPISRIAANDIIRIPPVSVAAPATMLLHQDHDFSWFEKHIIFEDEALIVINKPSGLAVHGGSGVSLGVIELLRHLRPACRHLELVHRLDKETSGCLLITKKRVLLKELHQLLRDKKTKKTYLALLSGRWTGDVIQVVTVPLEKYSGRAGERLVKVSEAGKASETEFRLLNNYADCCLVEATPKTGRTHQIRVHAAFLGHPIVCDEKYNDPSNNKHMQQKGCKRLMLHAKAIKFRLTDLKVDSYYEATLDDAMQGFLKSLE